MVLCGKYYRFLISLIYILILKYLLRMGFVVFFMVGINNLINVEFYAILAVFNVKRGVLVKFLVDVLTLVGWTIFLDLQERDYNTRITVTY